MAISGELLHLNKEQKQAVLYDEGPLLIVAGAGTGKTTVISEKVKNLIRNKVSPEEILALTFTEKAASEMEERIDTILPYGYFQLWISTFHAFADQILRAEISAIGLSPGYRLLTPAESVLFLKKNLFLFDLKYFRPLGNPNKFIDAMLAHFSRLMDEDISPKEYLAWAKHTKKNKDLEPEEIAKNLELANAYSTYQKLKIKEGYFEFSDLIYYLLLLFRTRKNILAKYQRQFLNVLVDEFQDTNIAQYELIKLLCPPKEAPRLTVVGDDSQAIYKFRGASVSNILAFMHDYAPAKQVTLTTNYRSNQNILDTAYRLIRHNDPDTLESQLGISKKLTSSSGNKPSKSVHFFLAERVENEADFVAQEIKKLTKAKTSKLSYSDFAILLRANGHAEPFIRALSQQGIPYQFLGPGQLFKQPEVKDLIAYLNFIADPEDSVSLYRVLTMDIFGLDHKDLAYLLSFAKKTAQPLFRAIEITLASKNPSMNKPEFELYKSNVPTLHHTTHQNLLEIYQMVERHHKRAARESAGQLLYYFLEDTKLLGKLTAYNSVREEKIAFNISKFFDKLKRYEIEHEDASVTAICDYIKMSMELGESPITQEADIGGYDAVNLLTIHSAKGLEFPIVFLVNLTQGRFPTYERREAIPIPAELIKEKLPEGNYHLLEERRLFYVGLTRAQDRAYLTASQLYAEGKRERKVSTFVHEALGQEVISRAMLTKQAQKDQLTIFDFKKRDENVIKKPYTATTFSFSQLDTYMRCPLQYKYQYVVKVPTPANAAASLGTSIHTALERFYKEFLENASVGLPRLIELYREVWIPLGYASPAHEARMKKEGEQMLTSYFDTFHTSNTSPIALEKLFKIKLGEQTYLSGKIDRVDKHTNGSLEIIDYKTGKKPDEKKLEKSLQLTIYLLAASDRALYNKPISDISLTFYYLQDNDKITIRKSKEEVMDAKSEIQETIEKLKSSEFTAHVGPWCDFCPFRMICEAWQ